MSGSGHAGGQRDVTLVARVSHALTAGRYRQVAGRAPSRSYADESRTFAAAGIESGLTTRRERAAVNRLVQPRRDSGNRLQRRVAEQAGRGREQLTGVGVLSGALDVADRRLLHHTARVHHREPGAGCGGRCQIVGDQDQGEIEFVGQVGEQPEYAVLNDHVQRRGGLICQKDLGLAGQGHRDRGSLPHPARQFMRVGLLDAGREPGKHEQFACPRPGRGTRRRPVHLHRLGDLPADGANRIERVHRALEHRGDITPPPGVASSLTIAEQVTPVQPDVACHRCGWREQAHQGEDRGCLS